MAAVPKRQKIRVKMSKIRLNRRSKYERNLIEWQMCCPIKGNIKCLGTEVKRKINFEGKLLKL